MSKPKIGEGHLAGMGRKGLSELAQYLPAFNQAGTQTLEDPAIWPNKTQGEIAMSRAGGEAERQAALRAEMEQMRGGPEPSRGR